MLMEANTINGIINVRKEKGFTSHDVVAKLRGILHTRKIGHTGTLDPMAEGVLPVCIGGATKLCESFTEHNKEYIATLRLGEVYDTQDVTGELLEQREVTVDEAEFITAVKSFIGGYEQIPPMYSAKKVDGKKLYELARKGQTVERKPVFVDIFDIEVLDLVIPNATIRVRCGKGTYIRTLIADIGEKLGCGASMESLTRTEVGDFNIKDSHSLAEIEKAAAENKITDVTIEVEQIFASLKRLDADEKLTKALRNGNVLRVGDFALRNANANANASANANANANAEGCGLADGEKVRIYDCDGKFVAVYEYKKTSDILKAYKMFL